MKKEAILEIYKSHDSEKLYSVFINMTNRIKYKQFDTFNTIEQIEKSIEVLIEIFKDRGIVFKELEMGKKWIETDYTEFKTYIKLYGKSKKHQLSMRFEAIGQY